jgi:SOS-response transcriptional repressor LexA
MEDVIRLSPAMVSRKLQVLDFILKFYRARGQGPSLGEIANGVGTSKTRVQAHVRKLHAEGLIHRTPGAHRSLRPLTQQEDALRQLRENGWVVNAELRELSGPVLDL